MNRAIQEIKPHFDQSAKRWEAYWHHDLTDRSILIASLAKPGFTPHAHVTYRDRVYGNLDIIMNNTLDNARNTLWLGDSIPNFWASLGTHEIASFCGYETEWAADGLDMNWCKHADRNWDEILPIRLDKTGFWWKRTVEVYEKTKQILQGRLIPYSMDFHTNLDLLLSIRGDAELCIDSLDCPDMVDKGIEDACEVFKDLWELFKAVSGCEEYGYFCSLYSEKPTTSLACDFSALIGPELFHRWGVAALTYESELVGDRTVYHWDGPDAIKHCDDLLAIKNIHTLSYVPSPYTYHTEFIELYQKCQAAGKGIYFAGSPEEIKQAYPLLNPALTVYQANVAGMEEFDALEDWMVKHR